MSEGLKRIIEEMSRILPPGPPPVSDTELNGAQGDEQVLKLMVRLFDEELETPLPPRFDQLLEKLTFTREEMLPDARLTAWSDFIGNHHVRFDYPHTLGIADWYSKRDMLGHAASVYEEYHRLARTNTDIGPEYLLDILCLYGELGDYQRARDFFGFVKDAFAEGEVSKDFLLEAKRYLIQTLDNLSPDQALVGDAELLNIREAYFELKNEFENARFEIARLKTGVLVDEERRAADEWLTEHQSILLRDLTPQARAHLTDAVMYVKTPALREHSFAWIPVLCGKAVETEFYEKVWRKIKERLGGKILPRYRKDLSINMICEILEGRGNNQMEGAFHEAARQVVVSLLGSPAILDPNLLDGLRSLKWHSTQGRHGEVGGREYKISQFSGFLGSVGIDRQDGWIFKFLSLCATRSR